MLPHSSSAPSVLVLLGILVACRSDNPLENRNDPAAGPPMVDAVSAADTLTPSADNLLRSSPANENQGLADSLRVKVDLGQSDTNRSVIRFDQAAIAARVGDRTLASATLELTIKGASTTQMVMISPCTVSRSRGRKLVRPGSAVTTPRSKTRSPTARVRHGS